MPSVTDDPHTMRCLEVWGGNQEVNNGVVMAGLDAWLYSRPYRGQTGGGDIHYVSSCAAGLLTRVLIADVSGHGETVADVARKLRELMRRYVNFIDQTRLVQGLNVEFGELSDAGGFATAIVATYLAPTDEFTLCNAGHPRPLWYQSKSRRWALVTATDQPTDGPTNIPLGIAEPTCYNHLSIKLATGDVIVLYTDSLIEAPGPDGQMLGEQGLLQLVRGLDPSDPGDFLAELLRSVAKYTGGEITGDDVTVLILRPNGLRPRVSMVRMLKAHLRMVGALLSRIFTGGPVFPSPETGPLARLGDWLDHSATRSKR